MLKTLTDIIVHDKKIEDMRILLKDIEGDFWEDRNGTPLINHEVIEARMSTENCIDELQLLAAKRYVKIVQKSIDDFANIAAEES